MTKKDTHLEIMAIWFPFLVDLESIGVSPLMDCNVHWKHPNQLKILITHFLTNFSILENWLDGLGSIENLLCQ